MSNQAPETRVFFDLPLIGSVGAGPEAAKLIGGRYLGIPHEDYPDLFDLFEVGEDGEPIGDRVAQIPAPEVAELIRRAQEEANLNQ